jgi:hypothetical protein
MFNLQTLCNVPGNWSDCSEDLDSILTPCPDISPKAAHGNTPVKAQKEYFVHLSVGKSGT